MKLGDRLRRSLVKSANAVGRGLNKVLNNPIERDREFKRKTMENSPAYRRQQEREYLKNYPY